MYYRYFFKCKGCGFMMTTLSQATSQINCCPSCEESNIDFAPKPDREAYVKNLIDELTYMEGVNE